MRIITTFLFILLFHSYIKGQVKTNYNSIKRITSTGQYNKSYRASVYDISPPDTNKIIERDAANKKINDVKPFRFAEPIPVNINVVESAQWIEDSSMAYGKFSIRVKTAKSLSVNFGDFFLPNETEMFIYNKSGNMITGPITERENNKNRIWGSSVYKGDELTIELKLPKASKKYLKLNIENVAFGYVEIYGFGNSSGCNINVLCALGNGWEQERNSVALILNQDGSSWCTGSLVNNTCNVAIPYFLTANHCFTGQDVTRWRFIFQYWSPTCTPNQDDLNNLLFNGSTLRANNAGSDFALVELSQTPDAASNITYAGWSRETTGKLQTTIIHHPAGDVMKISRDNDVPTFSNFLGAQCWQLGLDLGATNGGSSGAPYFDQNHRIIAQHYGINQNNSDQCLNTNKFGGRFDISWTGGGTNATRLSNWLDPSNSGALTTNTTNVALLTKIISGDDIICATSNNYTITNLPVGATVTWSATPNNIVNITCPTCSQTTLTKANDGVATLTATITNICGAPIIIHKPGIQIGFPFTETNTVVNAEDINISVSHPAEFIVTSYRWYMDGVFYRQTTAPLLKTTLTYQCHDWSVSFVTACGESPETYPISVGCDGGNMFVMSPNPAINNVTIDGSKKSKNVREVQIVDKLGNVRKVVKYAGKQKFVTLNISTLPPDIYYIKVFDGQEWEAKQLRKE